jgi:hypothetical protein
MELETLYRQLLSMVTPALGSNQYKKRASYFYIQKYGNWGLINFQRSTKNTSEQLIFTINLGIASSRLLQFFSVQCSEKGLKVWDCHWIRRLGELINGDDIWWTIESRTSIDKLGGQILKNLGKLAIPEIEQYLDDVKLRNLWLSGDSPSLTEFRRLMYLSVFLKELGPHELLEPTLRQLREISFGKPTSSTADIYIDKLLNR